MERWHINRRLIHEKDMLETNNLLINNGIFHGDSLFFFFCIDLTHLFIELKNLDYYHKSTMKKTFYYLMNI